MNGPGQPGGPNVLPKLFDEVAGAMPSNRKNETEDSSKKPGALFVKLNPRDVSASLNEKLKGYGHAGDHGGRLCWGEACASGDDDDELG